MQEAAAVELRLRVRLCRELNVLLNVCEAQRCEVTLYKDRVTVASL